MRLPNNLSKMVVIFKLFSLSFFLLLVGCVASVPQQSVELLNPIQRPLWIDNPGIGVSASAAVHVHGRTAQEQLAILRAREELAKQRGVKIDSQNINNQDVHNDRSISTSSKQIEETVSGAEVKAAMKEKWLDPGSQVLWVWVVPID